MAGSEVISCEIGSLPLLGGGNHNLNNGARLREHVNILPAAIEVSTDKGCGFFTLHASTARMRIAMSEPSPIEPDSRKAAATAEPTSTDPWWFSGDPDFAPIHHPWLERFLWLVAATTFLLIILGGTVTSKDAGLAVPDWPHTFGYNMLTYPPSKWVGGIFWEHTHRLLATLVGCLALILTGWVLFVTRLSMTIRMLGAAILVLVIIQGVMGGLRVTEISTALGVVHGVTGQLFFALVLITAIMAGKRWLKRPEVVHHAAGISSFKLSCVFLVVLVTQLALGATMRHYRAGLAIPDFPTAYGQIIPPLSTKGIEHAMDMHAGGDTHLEGYYSPFKVSIHFAHRLWAITVVLTAMYVLSILASRDQLKHPVVLKLSLAIIGLLLVQVCLGAFVIWSGRHPEIATAHQATGAAILGVATVLMMNLKMIPESSQGSAPLTPAIFSATASMESNA